MSGHSKWSTIKRQKGAADVKRGLAFTKLSIAITLAVRQGGGIGNPDQNFRLRLAIEAARNVNMPKDTIERAIQKALNKGGEGDVEEVVYEGFGPGGIAIMVDAATDNKNRTTSQMKSVFDKNGGTMGQPGTVSYQFKQTGQIIAASNTKTEDEIFLDVADAEGEDMEIVGEEIFIFTQPSKVMKVKKMLEEKGYIIKEADIIRKPVTTVTIMDEATMQKIIQLLDKLEELDDVQKVYANFISST